MADFLVEIGSEELPPREAPLALRQFTDNLVQMFKDQRIAHGEVKPYGTNRRLAVLVHNVSSNQTNISQTVIGPSIEVGMDSEGQVTHQALGFARKHGVKPENLEKVVTPKGEYLAVVEVQQGRRTIDVLKETIAGVIQSITFPKAIKCPETGVSFARPIRWLVAMLGKQPIKFSIGELSSGRKSRGHLLLSDCWVNITEPAKYPSIMRQSHVIVDPEERLQMITKQVNAQASRHDGRVSEGQELYELANWLVEYPTAVTGSYSEKFTSLPREVLTVCIVHYQKFFPLVSRTGTKPIGKFVGIRNGISEYTENVRRGYEAVVEARLADAQFFFSEDQREPLKSRASRLKGIIFNEKLGTMSDKTQRVTKLALALGPTAKASLNLVEQIANLAKADLTTHLVDEMPELAGIAGREYALKNGESPEVALGIYEHYLPDNRSTKLPSSPEAAIVGIADRLDTLCGDFAIGLVPAGSQDPYGLKKQCDGLITILRKKSIPLDVQEIVVLACKQFDEVVAKDAVAAGFQAPRKQFASVASSQSGLVSQVVDFIVQRLRNVLSQEGYAHGEIEACISAGCSRLDHFDGRITSLKAIRNHNDLKVISIAFKRATNILKQARKNGMDIDGLTFSRGLLVEPEEKTLADAVADTRKSVQGFVSALDYANALKEIAHIRPPLDIFFDKVLVMAEDQKMRENRLALLKEVLDIFSPIADFAQL